MTTWGTRMNTGAEGESKFRMLVHEMQNVSSDMVIYPAAVKGFNDERDYAQRDGFKNGWNAAVLEYGRALAEAASRASGGANEDLLLLLAADVGWLSEGHLRLNMNDTWAWAVADYEDVPEEKLRDVARLFRAYGNAGLLYWVSEERGGKRSAFEDVNRFIEFVRREEVLRDAEPSSSKRAYKKVTYTLGAE